MADNVDKELLVCASWVAAVVTVTICSVIVVTVDSHSVVSACLCMLITQQIGQHCCLLDMHLLVAMVLLVGLTAVVLSLMHSSTTWNYNDFQLYVCLRLTLSHCLFCIWICIETVFTLLFVMYVEIELLITLWTSHWHTACLSRVWLSLLTNRLHVFHVCCWFVVFASLKSFCCLLYSDSWAKQNYSMVFSSNQVLLPISVHESLCFISHCVEVSMKWSSPVIWCDVYYMSLSRMYFSAYVCVCVVMFRMAISSCLLSTSVRDKMNSFCMLTLTRYQRSVTASCVWFSLSCVSSLTLYRMVMPIGTPFLKEKINN